MQGSLVEQYNEEKSKHFYNIDLGAYKHKPKFYETEWFFNLLCIGVVLGISITVCFLI